MFLKHLGLTLLGCEIHWGQPVVLTFPFQGNMFLSYAKRKTKYDELLML